MKTLYISSSVGMILSTILSLTQTCLYVNGNDSKTDFNVMVALYCVTTVLVVMSAVTKIKHEES